MTNYDGNNGPDIRFIMVVAVLLALMGYAALKGLGESIGVDTTAAFTLVVGVTLAVALLGLGLWSQASGTWPLTVFNMLPLALASLIMSFSPALNQMGCIGPIEMCFDVRWWGRTSTHYMLSFAILLVGYGFLYLRRDRY